jgi:CRAL/TRIO domain
MEFTRYIIDVFKYYYPNSLNWILVYEMPWILNATFQIIKKLLPAKAVERLRFVNGKQMSDYVDLDNQLSIWGGNDNKPFVFKPEKRMNGHTNGIESPTTRRVSKMVLGNFHK